MVTSVSNSGAVQNNHAGVAQGSAANAVANASGPKQDGGKISYGNYNGASSKSAAPAQETPSASGDEGKLKEIDGMLNRLKEMLGDKGSPDKMKKDNAVDGGAGDKEALDKKDKLNMQDKPDTIDETDKTDGIDAIRRPDNLDKIEKTEGADETEKTDQSLKSRALDVLNKMSEVLMKVFGK